MLLVESPGKRGPGRPKSDDALVYAPTRLPANVLAAVERIAVENHRPVATILRELVCLGLVNEGFPGAAAGAAMSLANALPAPADDDELSVRDELGLTKAALRKAGKDLERLERELEASADAYTQLEAQTRELVAQKKEWLARELEPELEAPAGGTDPSRRLGSSSTNVVIATLELPPAKRPPAERARHGWIPGIAVNGRAIAVEVERERAGAPWTAVKDSRDMTEAVLELGLCTTPDTAIARAQARTVWSRW